LLLGTLFRNLGVIVLDWRHRRFYAPKRTARANCSDQSRAPGHDAQRHAIGDFPLAIPDAGSISIVCWLSSGAHGHAVAAVAPNLAGALTRIDIVFTDSPNLLYIVVCRSNWIQRIWS